MNIEKVAFIINETENCWQALRSAFGCMVENLWCGAFFIDSNIEAPSDLSEEEFKEHLESFVMDFEAEIYTNIKADADKYEHVKYLSLEDMIPKIKAYQLVVPF